MDAAIRARSALNSPRAAAALLAVWAAAGCGDNIGVTPPVPDAGPPAFVWDLPPGFPQPVVPEDNPMTTDKVELGRFLFYDTRLSGNQTQACASCHFQELGFAEDRQTSIGSTGDVVARNAPGLANAAYYTTLTWPNPLLHTFEMQVLVPIFGEFPVELGVTGHEDEVLGRLRADDAYQRMFAAAFPDDADPFTFGNVAKALGSFMRTLISGDSPYDKRTYQGDADAMSASARRGLDLFLSERLECHHCHGGFNFTGSVQWQGSPFAEVSFHNIGLYDIDGEGGYPQPNTGLFEFTGDPADMGKFRAPSLRNVAVTGPYMHDGSIATLDEVLDHYEAGGRDVTEGPNAGDGRLNPHKSGFLTGFQLTPQERADLLAMFEALTDDTFLTDPRFSNPFE